MRSSSSGVSIRAFFGALERLAVWRVDLRVPTAAGVRELDAEARSAFSASSTSSTSPFSSSDNSIASAKERFDGFFGGEMGSFLTRTVEAAESFLGAALRGRGRLTARNNLNTQAARSGQEAAYCCMCKSHAYPNRVSRPCLQGLCTSCQPSGRQYKANNNVNILSFSGYEGRTFV